MKTKICSKCGIEKFLSEFHKDKQKKDGYRPDCKECNIKRTKLYYYKYYEKAKKSRKDYYERNKNSINKYRRIHPEIARKSRIKLKIEKPWIKHYNKAKQRCTNKNNNRYYCYGQRGIKFNLTQEEIKELWFRDKAYLLNRPSIDRIDNDKNYTYDNCRFIELSENLKKSNIERKTKRR